MDIINSALRALFDGYFAVAAIPGRIFAMWFFSAVTGILFLYIFKFLSNQKAIKSAKNRIAAGFLEVRLFKDDFGQMMRAQGLIFRSTFAYMFFMFRPMLIMIVPVLLMVFQLEVWYGHEPLAVAADYKAPTQAAAEDQPMTGYWDGLAKTDAAQGVLVRARVADDVDLGSASVSLESDGGLVTASMVSVPENHELFWRVVPVSEGEHEMRLSVNGNVVSQMVHVGENNKFRKIETVRSKDFLDLLLHPGEPALPSDSPVERIEIAYPGEEIPLVFWNMHWIFVYFILSFVFGFALKGVFGVEI